MPPVQWIIQPKPAPGKVAPLAQELGLRPLVVELLLHRGLESPEEIVRFLHPKLQDLSDPFLLPEMDQAVTRIFQAVDRKEAVALYGDYDVDGVTSLTLLHGFLKSFGLAPHTFLPHRIDEGYGLNQQGLERCLSEHSPALLIAVDCGTSSVKEIQMLRDRGIDVIVLDHHEPSSDQRPPTVALVNPKLGDSFHDLCSAGIVFKLGHALLKQRRAPGLDLREWLDLVAMGTVADLVPLRDENRILVRKGLQQLARTIHPGVLALKSVAGVNGQPLAYDIGFKLGPRLNAAGRLDTAQTALDLLMCQDSSQAQELALSLDRQNRERQDLENRIRKEAEAMLAGFDPAAEPGIVLGSDTWHAGVVGIVASRISKQHHRPTFVIAFDESGFGKGSGRSIEGVCLVDAINACRELLIAGGGHEMAAGLSIRRENLDEFRRRFQDFVREHASAEVLRPRLQIDLVAEFADLDLDLLDHYELVHPMGMGNPAPLMMSRRVMLTNPPQVLKEKHLKLPLLQGSRQIDAMYFNADVAQLPPAPWDVAYRINRNDYRGRSTLAVFVEAIRPAE